MMCAELLPYCIHLFIYSQCRSVLKRGLLLHVRLQNLALSFSRIWVWLCNGSSFWKLLDITRVYGWCMSGGNHGGGGGYGDRLGLILLFFLCRIGFPGEFFFFFFDWGGGTSGVCTVCMCYMYA